jgi:hypothetical protein
MLTVGGTVAALVLANAQDTSRNWLTAEYSVQYLH